MNNDLIKWIVKEAKGFEYQIRDDLRFDTIKTPDSEFWNAKTIQNYYTRWDVLLQAAIENINRNAYKTLTYGNPKIFQNQDCIKIALHEKGKQIESYPVFFFKKYKSEIHTKEAVLAYLQEQTQ